MSEWMNIRGFAFGLATVAAVAAGFTAFFLWQNNNLMISRYTYNSPEVPAAFDGYTILHLSDLHSKSFGEGQTILLEQMKAAAPDLIVITGDLIDRRRHFEGGRDVRKLGVVARDPDIGARRADAQRGECWETR